MCSKPHTDRRCLSPRGVCERPLVRSLQTGGQAPCLHFAPSFLLNLSLSQVMWLTHSLSLVYWIRSSRLCCPSSTLASRPRAAPSSSSSPGGTHSIPPHIHITYIYPPTSSLSMQDSPRSRPLSVSPVYHHQSQRFTSRAPVEASAFPVCGSRICARLLSLWPLCSGDHDEKGMLSYYADMPFLALPYDGDEREAFMANYQVRQHTQARMLVANY